MNGRERILAVLQGEIPDRVPVGLFAQEEFLAYFFPARPQVDRVVEAVACAKALGFDVMTRSLTFNTPYFLKKSYLNWEVAHNVTRERDNLYYRTTITTPAGVLEQIEAAPYHERTAAGIHRTTTKYLLDAEPDFEIFRKFVPALDTASIREMKDIALQNKQEIGDVGVSAPWGWGGVYNQAATYRDVQKLMMDPYLNADFYQEYMNTLTRLIVQNYQCLGETAFDCLGIQGNIANAAMVGAKFFDQHILPYEQQVVAAIRQAGKYSLYHNCGKARVLYPSYAQLGMTIWETVAPPPQGDNDLAAAKAALGAQIVLAGNLDQVVFLKKATLAEVDAEVTRIMRIGKPGGKYIFAASDFLEKDTPLENIKKVVEVAIREGQY